MAYTIFVVMVAKNLEAMMHVGKGKNHLPTVHFYQDLSFQLEHGIRNKWIDYIK